MALIDTYKSQLAAYEAAEKRILNDGQSFTSEDGESLREANLSTIAEEKKRLQALINKMEGGNRPRFRQYPVDV